MRSTRPAFWTSFAAVIGVIGFVACGLYPAEDIVVSTGFLSLMFLGFSAVCVIVSAVLYVRAGTDRRDARGFDVTFPPDRGDAA